MKSKYTLIEKARILKRFMDKDEWYTSEKIRMLDATKQIKFNISTALSTLFEKGYLERKSSKRIYFESVRKLRRTKRYQGIWAYKFKPEFLKVNYEQTTINYGDCTQKES